MTQALPDLRTMDRPWHRRGRWNLAARLCAGVTLFAFISSQLLSLPALADEPVAAWLKEEQGGWVSPEQAKALQRADQVLLARLTAVEEAAQRLVTQHPGGIQALHVGQDLLVTRDSSNNLLFMPVLDENGELQEGTLVAEDGTLQVYQEGRLVRQVDPFGTETFFRTDGTPEYEIALDGTRTDVGLFTRVTHLPDGDLTQTYDSQWRLTGVTHPDGRSFSYSEGRLVSAQIEGVTYLYTHETAADSSVTAVLSGGEGTDLVRQLLYGADGSLIKVTQADGSIVRFTQGLPTQWVDPLGVVTNLTAEQSGRLITSLSVSREEVVRQYNRTGKLASLTLPDQSVLTLVDEAIRALRLPDGTRITGAEFDENSALISGLVILPDGRQITYADREPIRAQLPDGTAIFYSVGEPSRMTLPDGSEYSLIFRQAQGDREATWEAVRAEPVEARTESFTRLLYSEDWVLQEAVRGDGALLTYQSGRLSTLTQTDGTVISYAYDDAGRLTSTAAVSPDPGSPLIRTEYAYDRMREVLKIDPLAAAPAMTQTLPDGVIARYEPVGTGAGRRWELVRLTLADGQTVTDPADPALEAYLYPAASTPPPAPAAISPDQFLQPGPRLADQNGVTLVPGQVGNAAHFTRNQTQSLAASSPDVSLGDIDFTLSTWVYFDTAIANRVVLSKGTTFNNVEYILYTENNPHNIRFLISNSGRVTGRGTDYQLVDSAPIATQTWYHVLITYNAETDQLSLYLNNVLQGATILSGGAYAGSSPLEIGHSPSWAEYMDGRIDETGIWKRLLSEQERADLFNGSRPTDNASLTQGLSAFWTMEESSGYRESIQWNGVDAASSESSTLESPPAVPAATLEEHPALRSMRLPQEQESLRRLVSDGKLQLVAGAVAEPEPIYHYSYEFESSSEITVIQEIATGLTKRYRAGQLISQTDPDGAVTTYEYTADPNGYTDPLETALEAIRTLADGTAVRYQRLSPGSDEWMPVEAPLPDGRKITQFGKPGNPLITHNAVRSAPGKAGNAAHMNAADKAYLSVEDCPELSMGDADFTVAAWVYLESETSEVTLGKGDSNRSETIEYILYLTGQGTSRFFRFAVGNGSIWAGVSSSQTDIAPGRWYYVVAWYDAARDSINIQVNNGPADSMSYTGGSYDSIQPFAIGRHPNVDSGYWSGMIDEVGIWKKTLTDQERAELYQAGNGNPFSPGEYRFRFDSGGSLANRLSAYYTLDEETGIRSDATETPSLSEFTGETALPTDRVALQRLIDQGSLRLIQPVVAVRPELVEGQTSSILARSTITYQNKPRETFTYRYSTEPSLTHVTDSGGITRTFDTAGRIVAIEQPDGTLYALSYSRDLSDAQVTLLSRLKAEDPIALDILKNPEGKQITVQRLVRLRMPDNSWASNGFPPETVVEEEFDADGLLLSRTQANGQVTLYEDNRPMQTYDPQGNLATTFDYDSRGRLIKITLLAVRREVADRINQLKSDIPARRSQALEELARQRGIVIDQVQTQFSSARTQLQDQLGSLQGQLSSLEATPAHGRRGRRQKNEAMDQIRGAMNQVRDTQNNLEAQYSQSLGNLESQVESVRQQIETESARAVSEIETQSAEFHREILRQEISSIVISTYRAGIGRDPSDQEFQEEVQRLYDRYGTDPTAALDLTDLTQRIHALPDYSARVDQVAAIKQRVTAWLTEYVIASDAVAKQSRLSSLGLSSSEVVSLTQADVDRILLWLNSRSLHFGHSAFLALQEYLQGQSPAGTVPDLITLATEAILTDILTGVINPKMNSNADLEISLFTLGKRARHAGAFAVPAHVRFEDLGQILSGGPAIAHVNGNHYILITSIDADGVVTYREPNAGSTGQTLTMTRADFQKIWEGNVLSARAPPHAHQVLTDREAQRITGSFFGSFVSWMVKLIPFHNQIATALERIAIFIEDSIVAKILLPLPSVRNFFTSMLTSTSSILRGENIKESMRTLVMGALMVTLAIINPAAFAIGLVTSDLLKAAGANQTISSLVGAFVSGGITGGLNAAASATMTFAKAVGHGIATAIQSTAIAGTKLGLVKAGLDPSLASIGSIGIGTIANSLINGVQNPNVYDVTTHQPLMLHGLEALSYTLSTSLAPTLAGELAFYGVQKLGESIGLDPHISQIAGIPLQSAVKATVTPGRTTEGITNAIWEGLKSGVISVGLQTATQALGLDPFAGSLITRTLSGAISGAINPSHDIFGGIAEAFRQSAGNFSTIPPPPDPEDLRFIQNGVWNRAAYNQAIAQYESSRPVWMSEALAKTNNFNDDIRQVGLAQAVDNYATSIFHRDSVESLVQSFGSIKNAITQRMQQNKIQNIMLADGTAAKKLSLFDYQELALLLQEDPFGEFSLLGVTEDDLELRYQDLRADRRTRTTSMAQGTITRTYTSTKPDGTNFTANFIEEISSPGVTKVTIHDTGGNSYTLTSNSFQDIRLNSDGTVRDGILTTASGDTFEFKNNALIESHSRQKLDFSTNSADQLIPEAGILTSDLQGLWIEIKNALGQSSTISLVEDNSTSNSWSKALLKGLPGAEQYNSLSAAFSNSVLRQKIEDRSEQIINLLGGAGWYTEKQLHIRKENYLRTLSELAQRGSLDGLIIVFSDLSDIGLAVKAGEFISDRDDIQTAIDLLRKSPIGAVAQGVMERLSQNKPLEMYNHIGFIKELELPDGTRRLYVLEINPDGLGRPRLTPLEQKLYPSPLANAHQNITIYRANENALANVAAKRLVEANFDQRDLDNAQAGQVIWSVPTAPKYDWLQIAGLPRRPSSNTEICSSFLLRGFQLAGLTPFGFPQDLLSRVSPQEIVDSVTDWGRDIAEDGSW